MRIIGLDPGSTSGGLACITDEGQIISTHKCDATEHDIAAWMREMVDCDEPVTAVIEKVGANRGHGDRQQGASSMFAFGQNYGFLRGLLVALKIPFEEIAPQRWQKEFSLKRVDKDEPTTDKKNRHKAKAQQLFPDEKIPHWKADALLIAEYAKRLACMRF